MATRDPDATRRRLLDAAVSEFSRAGRAGARVDRIADAARANKRAIYDYFGDKDALFEAAVTHTIEQIVAAVPFTPDDLAGYVGRLYDFHTAHPEAVRLATWRTLEREPGDPLGDLEPYRRFVEMVGARPGSDPAVPPAELAVVLLALAPAWVLANHELVAVGGTGSEQVAARRAVLVEVVTRMLQPR
jgi:AcrR family transcriptional regulator